MEANLLWFENIQEFPQELEDFGIGEHNQYGKKNNIKFQFPYFIFKLGTIIGKFSTADHIFFNGFRSRFKADNCRCRRATHLFHILKCGFEMFLYRLVNKLAELLFVDHCFHGIFLFRPR